MKNYFGGVALKVVEKGFQGNVKDLAISFLLYGALAEIFARENGFNKGLGGSMHAFFTPFGIYPNNAIVGGIRRHFCRCRTLQKDKPETRNNRMQYWRCINGLRTCMGRHLFCHNGPV